MMEILKNIYKQHNYATFELKDPDILDIKDLENIKIMELKRDFWFKNEVIILDIRPIKEIFEELDNKDFHQNSHISAISIETINKQIKAVGYMDYRDYKNNSNILKLGKKVCLLGKVHSIKKYRNENLIVFQVKGIDN